MEYQTIIVNELPHQALSITINRPERRNAINSTLLEELGMALDAAEVNSEIRTIILQGQQGFFCTGMDFNEVAQGRSVSDTKYMEIVKRFTLIPKVMIAKLDGQVMAGGMGLVSACDLVVSTERSTFSLSEALWGLLPANVMPFLIRRVGFQKAYSMTLTTQTISAKQAESIYLIDELAEDLDDALRRLILRLTRLDEETIRDMKAYFRKMWIINHEMEQTAIDELARLVREPRIKNNISNFVENQKFPWDKG